MLWLRLRLLLWVHNLSTSQHVSASERAREVASPLAGARDVALRTDPRGACCSFSFCQTMASPPSSSVLGLRYCQRRNCLSHRIKRTDWPHLLLSAAGRHVGESSLILLAGLDDARRKPRRTSRCPRRSISSVVGHPAQGPADYIYMYSLDTLCRRLTLRSEPPRYAFFAVSHFGLNLSRYAPNPVSQKLAHPDRG